MSFPKVKIEDMELQENQYNDGNAIYNVLKLIEQSKKYPVFELPLAGINIGVSAWGSELSIDSFVYHCKRIEKASLEYPILLDNEGQICDGWHRICKALLEERTSIKAIRLEEMPEPDKYIEK